MVSARVRASFFAYSSRPQSGRFAVFQNTFSPILSANEICAALAIAGFDSNMTAYLIKKLHMPATKAANTLTNFGGTARRFHYFSTGNGCFNTVSNTFTTTASPM